MKRFCIALLPLLLVLGCTEPTPTAVTVEETVVAGKKGQKKVDVCHVTGNGSYILITIAEPALPAHLNHGDGQPGDPVPGMEGFVFDESCEPVIAVPTEGLVAYYPFNGNANDESGNGHHGTPVGATLTTDRFGSEDRAYLFDGNARVETPFKPVYGTGDPLTVSLWMQTDESQIAYIFGFERTQGGQVAADILSDGRVRFTFRDENANETQPISSSLITDGQGHLLTFVRDVATDQIRLYVDGVLKDTVTDITVTTVNSVLQLAMTIGADLNSTFGFILPFTGKIDEVRIYDRELSDGEINALCDVPAICSGN